MTKEDFYNKWDEQMRLCEWCAKQNYEIECSRCGFSDYCQSCETICNLCQLSMCKSCTRFHTKECIHYTDENIITK